MSETRDAQIRALMDPAALETRLAEARVRRAKVLSKRGGAGAKRSAPPQDLPPDAVHPLVSDGESSFTAPAGRSKQEASRADDAPAPPPRGAKLRDESPDAPDRVLTLVHPQQSPPKAGSTAVSVSDADTVPANSTVTAGVPPRRSGALLPLVALAAGAVLGLAGAALVPGLGGWQIVIVRPAEDGEAGSSASREPISSSMNRSSEAAEANEGEWGGAAVVPETPPTFGRLVMAGTAAVPGGQARAPRASPAQPEATVEPAARPELAFPVERAGGALPRIEAPEAPPQVRLPVLRAAEAPGRMPPPPPAAAAPSEAAAEAAATPELPLPGVRIGGEVPHIDEPEAPARVRMTTMAASGMPKNRPVAMPVEPLTTSRFEPAWQVPALEVPATPRPGGALRRIPSPPAPPAASQDELISAARTASIVVHHPPDAAQSAEAAQRALALAGADTAVMREVGFSIRSPNVRYYHEEDRRAAIEVADLLTSALGDEAAARDFTDYEPAPDPGLIEVWIDGSAPVTPRPAATRADATEAERERLIRSIEERLRERLQ